MRERGWKDNFDSPKTTNWMSGGLDTSTSVGNQRVIQRSDICPGVEAGLECSKVVSSLAS